MFDGRFALLFSIFLLILAGCSGEPEAADRSSDGPEKGASARIVITAEFGQALIMEETIDIGSSTSAMQALKRVADVETKYGGGFVDDINGLRSEYGDGWDWLICVNGIQTRTGALDYRLSPDDVALFDFHDWSFRIFTPATIGAFPEPFLHGYGGKVYPTYIVYEGNFKERASLLAEKLRDFGIEQVSVGSLAQLTKEAQQSGNLILIGSMNSDLINELNDIRDKMGFFTNFENGRLLVFDEEGELAGEFGAGTGLIQATQNPWNPKGIGACENVVWMVSGVDDTGVKAAVDTLLNRGEKLKYAFAVVVTSEEILFVPPFE